jgi:hypothetical protein
VSNARRVAITGLGAISAVGVGVPAFWDGLLAGRGGFRRIERFDPSPLLVPIAVVAIVMLTQRLRLPAFLAIMATVVVYGIAADMTFQSVGKAFGLGFTAALEQIGLGLLLAHIDLGPERRRRQSDKQYNFRQAHRHSPDLIAASESTRPCPRHARRSYSHPGRVANRRSDS